MDEEKSEWSRWIWVDEIRMDGWIWLQFGFVGFC